MRLLNSMSQKFPKIVASRQSLRYTLFVSVVQPLWKICLFSGKTRCADEWIDSSYFPGQQEKRLANCDAISLIAQELLIAVILIDAPCLVNHVKMSQCNEGFANVIQATSDVWATLRWSRAFLVSKLSSALFSSTRVSRVSPFSKRNLQVLWNKAFQPRFLSIGWLVEMPPIQSWFSKFNHLLYLILAKPR